MPSLFGSRRRGSSAQPPVDRISSTNAAAAASQAMYHTSTTATPLSSAAAAAALRSANTTPEPIGNLQTKRMVRRGSVSSINSNLSTTSRGGAATARSASLTRPSSSMSERTFRGQSPARNRAVSPAVNAPPVPALPNNIPDARHRRSNSLDPPQRVTSPTPPKGERSASVDPHTTRVLHSQPPPSANRNSKRLSDVAEELERSDSTRNRNFSRPIATPSPPASPSTANMSKPVGRPAATSRAQALEQKIARIQAAAAPQSNTSTAWAAAAPATGQGSHLSQSNRSAPAPAPIKTTAPEPREQETIMVFDPNTRTFVPRVRDKPKVVQPASPALPPPKALVPGTYDPNTRSIVPHPPTSQSTSPLSTRASARSSPATSPSPASRVPQSQPTAVRKDTGAQGQNGLLTPSPSVTKMPAASPQTPVVVKPATTSPAVASGGRVVGGRTLSTSPSPVRSAHFSASPVIEATKHEPPARSVSPAKSALKHSPAPSLRAASPLAHLSSIGPPSEISDTASQTSQDGSSSATKKKKSVRVSFDEQAQAIAPPSKPVVASPRTPSFTRSPLSDDDSDDEIMKPRPALPSFGSVRRNRPEVAEKVTEVPPARTPEAGSGSGGSDPAGGVADKKTGYDTDESEDLENIGVATSGVDDVPAAAAAVAATPTAAKEITTDVIPTGEGEVIPSIELLPPTPGEEGKPLGDTADTASDTSEEHVAQPSAAETSPEDGPVAPLAAINEDSDDSNQFSDAPEDLSDNGGFISLDAVAISPINTTSNTRPTSYAESPPASPSVQQAAKKGHQRGSVVGESSPHHGSGDWSEATQYWSKLSKSQRDQIEREEETARAASPTNDTTKAKLASATAGAAVVGTAVAAATTQKPAAATTTASTASKTSTTAAQPPKPAMKKSMRAPPPAEPASSEPDSSSSSMRRTMRNGTATGLATSLRNGPPPPRQTSSAPQTNGTTTVKPQQDSAYPRIAKPAANRVSQPAPIVSARLQKELADDSDSESSFRRKKKSGAAAANGRYTMKRSMRGAPDRASSSAAATSAPRRPSSRTTSPEPSSRGKDSFSMRSLSPSGSLFNRNRGESLRSSLRSGSVDATNSRMSLRGGPPPAASSSGGRRRPTSSASMSSFGARPASVAAAPVAPAKYKSRFADSDSDEEGGGGFGRSGRSMGFFRSRFGAESDEDDDDVFIPADLTPVRGIPRRSGQNDGDSTDLEDSDDEDDISAAAPAKAKGKGGKSKLGQPTEAEIDAAMEVARKKLGIAAPASDAKQGTALSRGSLRGKSAANGDASQPEPKSRPEDVRDSPPPPSVTGVGETKKKRGLMGSLLRRNRSSVASVPTVADLASYPPSPSLATPTKQTSTGTTTASPPEAVMTTPPPATATAAGTDSPSSPFTKLLRNSAPPALKRGDSNYSTMTAPPDVRPPHGDSPWPVPPVPPIPTSILSSSSGRMQARPSTSDGVDIETASAPGDRRTSVRFMEIDADIAAAAGRKPNGAGANGTEKERDSRAVYSQRTGKKKKFGVLRRAFGLND